MKTFLEGEGFEVESFDSAQDASMTIGSSMVDMVIMGLTFADSEGKEFFNKITESFAGPIIIISSSVDEKNKAELIARGAKAAIDKSDHWQLSLKPHLAALK